MPRMNTGNKLKVLPTAYNLLLYTVGWGLLPLVISKAGPDPLFRKGRFGRYDEQMNRRAAHRIWIHAASVGEVTGAIPVLKALQERLAHASIFLTAATPQGFAFARKGLPEQVKVLPFPLDFPHVLTRALRQLQPDLYVALEGEFWPNLYRTLHYHGIPTVLLNGRLSNRSANLYRLFKPLFKSIFERFQWLAMHSDEDLKNILTLGANPERSLVLGSSKYEGLLSRAQPEAPEKWRAILSIPSGVPVLVGGSLRRNECFDLPEIYRELKTNKPQLIGIFAPRHLEQVPRMVHWLQSRGLPFQCLSHLEKGMERRHTPIILVDKIGVLFELYSIGDLIFCGGTLAPIGGHNILEPAAWKKAVFYGPHLQKVDYEHKILRTYGGGFMVEDKNDLLCTWNRWINHLQELSEHGEKAMQALKQMKGVVAKQVDLIVSALPE
jgi:3-deoxy-D-manno-octulosonic-acid transferase